MTFSPTNLPVLILGPLRYFFSAYGDQSKFLWDPDEKKRTVDISHVNDFFKKPLEERPRILVDRGAFRVDKVGITDNLAEQKSFHETMGLKDQINMTLYTGAAQIMVEARNMGTCEILADMACHFLTWARPEICDLQKFKEFALPLSVSPCQLVEKENTEKFQIQISVPWSREEHWRVRNDGVTMKNAILTLGNLTV